MPRGIPRDGINLGWIKSGDTLRKGIKLTDKQRATLSNSLKGRTPWNKGVKINRDKYPKMGHFKPHNKTARLKMKLNHRGTLGKQYSMESRKKMSIWQKNKPKLNNRGKCHWNWMGGITPEYRKIRSTLETTQWKRICLERDNFVCQKCGQSGGVLNVHHINNFSEFSELRTITTNGITFCEKCHKEFHKKYGYKNNTREQLENFLNNN